jgi:formate hydrogenlyase transcriptional activator
MSANDSALKYRTLLEISEAFIVHQDCNTLFRGLWTSLRKLIRFDFLVLMLYNEGSPVASRHAIAAEEEIDATVGRDMPLAGTPAGLVIETQQPLYVPDLNAETRFRPEIMELFKRYQIQSGLWVPLTTTHRRVGTLSFASRQLDPYTAEDREFMQLVARQVAIAVENAMAFEEIRELRERIEGEKVYLEEEIRSEYRFDEMIGQSRALLRVLQQVETAAPTNSTVLIQGETGTGKELVARAIHQLSRRNQSTFVKLNCSAIPAGLLESELLGHEKGAFTGALAQRIGRFELAHGGTLFLDEVGELPLELQPKLLRVLQDGQFERLGGSRTIQSDFRLVVATNQDLRQRVSENRFRMDLYYRLNVFPITIPPLRERREDIPMLVRYFVQEYAKRMGKQIQAIPTETMEALVNYSWPGNVRELRNIIERSVILTTGKRLYVPKEELKEPTQLPEPSVARMEDAERRHILEALNATNWVISGPKGAAALLGLKRSTLQSRMEKLGIRRARTAERH